jgi:putative DNA methylase
VAFPLRQASLDAVHEKSVRHGHLSTLHIWPARRPLAASRAALIATLLPDPGTSAGRQTLVTKLGGTIVRRPHKQSGKIKEETVGGILHWGRESHPDVAWFRKQIRIACGGRAPRVLDPFAGGGAIPFEAMRLGCEVTAGDINPVAWFVLKCTLEYPQRLAGKTWRLPDFALESAAFCAAWAKHRGKRRPTQGKELPASANPGQMAFLSAPEADLSWHIRAWGQWLVDRVRHDLQAFYPTVDGKPTVAYLWARTVTCKNCRATVPLLKTKWLVRKDAKRVLLTVTPREDGTGVDLDIDHRVPPATGSAAQRKQRDKQLGQGTMSGSGVTCPVCSTIMTMEDLRLEGRAGRLGTVMTAVVVDGAKGKEYRRPTPLEIERAEAAIAELDRVFASVPFGLPEEPTPTRSQFSGVANYGFDRWSKLFTPRQLLALGTITQAIREVRSEAAACGYPPEWTETISAYLAAALDRVADRGSSVCHWDVSYEKISNTFSAFRLPITWDFSETNPIGDTSGSLAGQLEWVARFVDHALLATAGVPAPAVHRVSAIAAAYEGMDVVLTDPPYYDAIPYADLMDFFYVWLRRSLHGLSPELDTAFDAPLSPKWDQDAQDGELIDDASRFGGDREASKRAYEEGMFRAFQQSYRALGPEGRLVIVFAHKQPDAWETLVSAIIRAGFVVDASWPIQTEMSNRTRALSSAALSSSVWLVCRKRSPAARPGWDGTVLEAMQAQLATRLRDYWDAGLRGPDFVWAATGPALEAYSRHPAVRKANSPGSLMEVAEFLQQVRRMVVDFVVGRVLSQQGAADASGLDAVTTYYLLHRYDFGMEPAPIGSVILYAMSCGLSDGALVKPWDVVARKGASSTGSDAALAADSIDDADDEEDRNEGGGGGGETARLKPWDQRRAKTLGEDAPGRPAPLIDQLHRLMQVWATGDVGEVDRYIDRRGLRRNMLVAPVLQALIELAEAGGRERALLESVSNHLQGRGMPLSQEQARFVGLGDADEYTK